jgi:PAS domain S-box-containing protein
MLLEQILLHAPSFIFWKDLKGRFLGCNKAFFKISGLRSYGDLIGKGDMELPWSPHAEQYCKDDQYVMRTGETITKTEKIPLDDHIIISETTKTPLLQHNKIIGVLAICFDVTDRKKVESLHIEKLAEQAKFMKTVLQVVHDIRSPLMIIDILSGETSHFPEEQRVLLRNATQRINDITSNLLSTYKSSHHSGATQELPFFVFLSRLFSEKQLQYAKHNIQFKLDISEEAYFAFTVFGLSDLQRILSNLINNAVEAITQEGLIKITLKTEGANLLLRIEDNGKGIPKSVLDKLGQMGVSYDKTTGTGLGLSHAIETVGKNHGKLYIDTVMGQGTKIALTFLQSKAPAWFAQVLQISPANIIVILDDDSSIHYLWDKKFAELKLANPIYHFHFDHEFEKWASEYPDLLGEVIFLCDNELIGSSLQGLALIEKYRSQVQYSLLVTSYYAFHELATALLHIQAQLLPKELVMQLPILGVK